MCEIISGSTYGYDARSWEQAKSEAICAIIRQAGPISYSELAGHIRSIRFDPHDSSLHHLLGQISVEEDAAGRGMLSVLVVRQSDGMPGQGFFDLAQRLGRDISDRERCWVKETGEVLNHCYNHPLVAA